MVEHLMELDNYTSQQSKKRSYDIFIAECKKSNNGNNDKKPDNKPNVPDNKRRKPNSPNQPNQPIPPFLLMLLADSMNDNNGTDPIIPPPDEPIEPVCPGKNCDHDPESKNIPKIPNGLINRSASYKITLGNLIDLGACYHCKCQTEFFNLSLKKLADLHDPLVKLQDLIGMKIIKENFVEQIVYFLLDLEPNPTEMLHTILVGPPGVGKSLIIDVIAEIYLKMGYLTKNIVKKVKINDLKGKYIGHTAPMTQKAIDEAMGGILVIDEAYSLGNAGKIESFSKEIIDTLNRNLTENAGKFICVIAGYEDQIDKCLFAHNIGLRSRFRFRFSIDTYDSDELLEIFCLKVVKDNWQIDENVRETDIRKFFKDKYESFKYFGRDMETLLFHTKMAHSNRILFESKQFTKKITMLDIKNGYNRFLLHNGIKKAEPMSDSIRHLYT